MNMKPEHAEIRDGKLIWDVPPAVDLWNFGTRVISGTPSGFLIRDAADEVVAIVPKNAPRTQAECEAIARAITLAHNMAVKPTAAPVVRDRYGTMTIVSTRLLGPNKRFRLQKMRTCFGGAEYLGFDAGDITDAEVRAGKRLDHFAQGTYREVMAAIKRRRACDTK